MQTDESLLTFQFGRVVGREDARADANRNLFMLVYLFLCGKLQLSFSRLAL